MGSALENSGFSRIVLPNGLTILVLSKEHGTISFGIGVRFGSAHHPASHLIEHVLFTGTKNRSEENIRREATRWGGYFDAYVGFFSTFFVTKNLVFRGYKPLEILCDMIANSVFAGDKIENQRNTVLDEHERRSNEPETMLMNRLYRTIYCDTPLECAVVDDTDTLYKLKRAELLKLYQKYYIPSRLVVVAVGPVETKKIVETVKRYFPNSLKKRDSARPITVFSEPSESPSGRIVIPKNAAGQAHIMAGFRAVPCTHPDFYPLRVLSMIVGESTDSRLFRATRGTSGLVYNITSHFDTVRPAGQGALRADVTSYHGMLRIYSFCKQKKLRRVENVIREELRKLSEKRVSREELTRNKKRVIGKPMLAMQGTHQEMRMLFAAEINDNVDAFFAFEEKIRTVTAEDVRRVAEKYCAPNQGVWVILSPKPKHT